MISLLWVSFQNLKTLFYSEDIARRFLVSKLPEKNINTVASLSDGWFSVALLCLVSQHRTLKVVCCRPRNRFLCVSILTPQVLRFGAFDIISDLVVGTQQGPIGLWSRLLGLEFKCRGRYWGWEWNVNIYRRSIYAVRHAFDVKHEEIAA